MPPDYLVRPMVAGDVPAVERLTDAAFFDLDVRTRRPGWPEPTHRSEAKAAVWRARVEHLAADRSPRLLGGRGRARPAGCGGQHEA